MISIFDRQPSAAAPSTTLDLLNLAAQQANLGGWAERLGLSTQALRTARSRGRVAPAIAGALAEELGQDPAHWIVVAALETEKPSACKVRMLKRFGLLP